MRKTMRRSMSTGGVPVELVLLAKVRPAAEEERDSDTIARTPLGARS